MINILHCFLKIVSKDANTTIVEQEYRALKVKGRGGAKQWAYYSG
jgi:hypothetical protein